MRKARIFCSVILVSCLLLMTGCTSTLGSNTDTFFSQMNQKINIWKTSSEALSQLENVSETEPPATEVDDGRIALNSPGNWTVTDEGEYSFDAVDGADYYIVYLYDTLSEDTSFSYMSTNIENDGSASYTGKLADLFDYCYGLYSAEVVAYPAVGEQGVKKSEATKCDFSVVGEVPEASVGYLWDCFTGTLGIELMNIEEYGASSFPTSVQVTFTNQADSSDVITLGFENASVLEDVFYASTQDVAVDATYAISATLSWNAEVVTNAEMTLDLGTVTTASNKNAMTDGYGYLNNTIYQSMDYPMVVTDFDPEVGGTAGTWYFYINAFVTNKGVSIPSTFKDCLNFQGEKGAMGAEYHDGEDVEFTVTPAETSAGSAYSYTLNVQGPRGVVSLFDGFFYNDMPAGTGSLELYEDGTFLMTIDPPSGDGGGWGPRGLSGSTISGLWVENGEGTLTLSYDHTSAALT